MKGFIRNESDRVVFSFKRSTSPGGKISLDEIYKIVGERSGKQKGAAFVKWLQENHLNNSAWVAYKEEGSSYYSPEELESVIKGDARGAGKQMRRKSEQLEASNDKVKRIIETPIEQARPIIDKCNDRGILKKALASAKVYAGKEAHMRHLIKRLEQVY